MPPANLRRRRSLADAAIALLVEEGVHGLTHRAVEARAGVPAGTATNYFRSREALLVAAAERVLELHFADVAAATEGRTGPTGPDELVDMIAASLWGAATALRGRYLAIFELRMEARRRPALERVLGRLERAAVAETAALHAALGTPVSEEAVATLATLYGGALFTLVTGPVGAFDEAGVRALVASMVHGALAADRDADRRSRDGAGRTP
ncbi:TetR/AcrR family transcriptional regulator [Nocardiopsis flavescens]|uniref:TetR/AcrR family transcriptional regulator n=1 Tax=Nocardiopsis flavescens TaxID=758803 RepID=UPI003655658D